MPFPSHNLQIVAHAEGDGRGIVWRSSLGLNTIKHD